jgi:hypothetical protein
MEGGYTIPMETTPLMCTNNIYNKPEKDILISIFRIIGWIRHRNKNKNQPVSG